MKYANILNNPELIALRSDAFVANREYGEIINTDTDRAEKDRRNAVVKERVAKYNDATMKFVFKTWLESDAPMKEALLDGEFPTLKQTVKGKAGAQTVAMEDTTRIFTVIDFINYANDAGYENPVHDKAWFAQAEEAHKALCG